MYVRRICLHFWNGLWCALSSKMKIEFGCTSCTYYWKSSYKETSFKIAPKFKCMNAIWWADIISNDNTGSDNININNSSSSNTSSTTTTMIWNASFIHSTSELNFPFAFKCTDIESDFAIDKSTQKRQFTHGIVCFWGINNYPHARFICICSRRLSVPNADIFDECQTFHIVVLYRNWQSLKTPDFRYGIQSYVDSKHYDGVSIFYWFRVKADIGSSAVICFRSLQCVCVNCFLD